MSTYLFRTMNVGANDERGKVYYFTTKYKDGLNNIVRKGHKTNFINAFNKYGDKSFKTTLIQSFENDKLANAVKYDLIYFHKVEFGENTLYNNLKFSSYLSRIRAMYENYQDRDGEYVKSLLLNVHRSIDGTHLYATLDNIIEDDIDYAVTIENVVTGNYVKDKYYQLIDSNNNLCGVYSTNYLESKFSISGRGTYFTGIIDKKEYTFLHKKEYEHNSSVDRIYQYFNDNKVYVYLDASTGYIHEIFKSLKDVAYELNYSYKNLEKQFTDSNEQLTIKGNKKDYILTTIEKYKELEFDNDSFIIEFEDKFDLELIREIVISNTKFFSYMELCLFFQKFGVSNLESCKLLLNYLANELWFNSYVIRYVILKYLDNDMCHNMRILLTDDIFEYLLNLSDLKDF